MDDPFSRFFGDAWRHSRPVQGDRTPTWWPAVQSYRQNGTLCIRVALPGVDPKDVDVSVTDQTLTITASRKAAHEGVSPRGSRVVSGGGVSVSRMVVS
jgi:HSP20 family molecular chaperone IbpA